MLYAMRALVLLMILDQTADAKLSRMLASATWRPYWRNAREGRFRVRNRPSSYLTVRAGASNVRSFQAEDSVAATPKSEKLTFWCVFILASS